MILILAEAEALEENIDVEAIMHSSPPVFQALLFHFLDQVNFYENT